MKKILFSLMLLFVFPAVVFAKDEKLVKVYVYEAGGCPYCEAQIEYLKGLKSYNKKFTIVQKELYVDHIEWKPGKDYETGVKVANTFKAAGFKEADYHGTPFVVISDLYAATSYSTELSSIIDDAYEKGDKDIVSCIESGKDECIKGVTAKDVEEAAKAAETGDDSGNGNADTYARTSSGSTSSDVVATTIICTIVLLAVYLIKSNKDKNEILDRIRR